MWMYQEGERSGFAYVKVERGSGERCVPEDRVGELSLACSYRNLGNIHRFHVPAAADVF